jgi:sugar O-acyltransferase (sialic acid O-acetyltransferase NeuD family)
VKPTDLVIVGTGGHAREVLDVVEALNHAGARYEVLGFLDDRAAAHGAEVRGHRVLGGIDWLDGHRGPPPQVVIGIGSPAARRLVALRLGTRGAPAATLVHPGASVTPHVVMGAGTVITVGAVVTSSVVLGEHVHVNVGASVSHDCRLGSYTTLAPGVRLAGNVTVGEGCDLGIGAAAIQGIAIGEWSIVGAGAVVTRALPANVTAVGVPARASKSRRAGWHDELPAARSATGGPEG